MSDFKLRYNDAVYLNRGLTVDAIIIKDEKILLIKRKHNPAKGSWALPGGFIEWHESAEDALKREVMEETGLEVISASLIGVYTDPKREPRETMSVCFSVETKGEVKAGDDAEEFLFYSINNLPQIAFDHKKMIEDFISKKSEV